MKKTSLVVVILLLMGVFNVAANDYLLCPGDVLSINILTAADIANFSGDGGITMNEIMVRPDGKLAVPLVGQIKVEGLTLEDVSDVITERLKWYFVDAPSVAVNLVKFHTTKIYVLGEVNRPGLYEMTRSSNLVDAIALANGWTKEAAKKKVFIISKDTQEKPVKVNLMDILEKGNTRKNYTLKEGDIVYLSNNGKINIVTDVLPFINSEYEIRHWSQD